MFISKETKMTKIFLGDTLLWEEPDTVVLHGETVPAKSTGVAQNGIIGERAVNSDEIYIAGYMNIEKISNRYIDIANPKGMPGCHLLAILSPIPIQKSYILPYASGSTIYGTPDFFLIGNDTYTDAYRYLTVAFLVPNGATYNTISIDCQSARNDIFVSSIFLSNVSPENIVRIDETGIVSSDNMVFTPTPKYRNSKRVYVLANLYSENIDLSVNNWSVSRPDLIYKNVYNNRFSVYSDGNTESIYTPTFILSSGCATDGVHGPDLPNVAKAITYEVVQN